MPEEDFEIFLSLLSQLLRLDPQQKSAIADELRDHMEERLQDLQDQGIPRKEAVRKALEEFGDAAGLASRFTSLSHHRRRRLLMRCTLATSVLAGVVFLAVFLFGPGDFDGPPNQQAQAQQTEPSEESPLSDFPTLMPDVLLKEVDVEFSETPLSDAVEFLRDATNLPTFIDKKALEEEGVGLDTPVALSAKKAPFYLILNRMVKPLGLAWYAKDDLLFFTTRIAAEENLFTKYYPVKPLLDLGYTEMHIVDLVQNMTSGPWEDLDGTGGRAEFMGQTLMVRQTFKVHLEIADLLSGLKKTNQPIVRLEPKEHAQLRSAMSTVVEVDFREFPLIEPAEFLRDAVGVPIVLDKPALSEEGISPDTPVSLKLKGHSLETILDLLLRPLNAEAAFEDGTILITTEIVAEDKLTNVIYNVKDIADNANSMHQLTEAIYAVTEGPWINTDGTGGDISWFPFGTMVVRQQERVHQEIATLLQHQRKAGGEVKLWSQPSEPYTHIYRMNADTAEDLLATLPEFVAPGTWQTETTKGAGTIRKVAAGQTFVKYPPAKADEKKPKKPEAQPGEKPAKPEAETEPQYIVVPQAVLIIRQTREVHREIESFLRHLLPADAIGTGTQPSGGGFF